MFDDIQKIASKVRDTVAGLGDKVKHEVEELTKMRATDTPHPARTSRWSHPMCRKRDRARQPLLSDFANKQVAELCHTAPSQCTALRASDGKLYHIDSSLHDTLIDNKAC